MDTKTVTVEPAVEAALIPATAEVVEYVRPGDGAMKMIEKLARVKDMDPAKLRELIAAQKEILALNAEAVFNQAFAAMQPELPEIEENGKRIVKGELHNTYAKYEDIMKAIRPVLARFGFSISFRTSFPDAATIRVTGILSHAMGHSRESMFEGLPDVGGSKNALQERASTTQYGRRYTLIDLLGLSTRGADDDGQAGGDAMSRARDAAQGDKPKREYKTDPNDTRPITDKQVSRLRAIVKEAGRTNQEMREYLWSCFGVSSSEKIERRYYDRICEAVTKPGKLPEAEEPTL